jgi:hypothetical protein
VDAATGSCGCHYIAMETRDTHHMSAQRLASKHSSDNILLHGQQDIEMGSVGGSSSSSSSNKNGAESTPVEGNDPTSKPIKSHLDYDYNEETDDLITDIAESTNSLIFSKFWTSIVLSHVVLIAQLTACGVILQAPFQVYEYHGGAGSWLTLFGVLLMSSEAYGEWNDIVRYVSCFVRQSRQYMMLCTPHLLMVLTMGSLVPIVMCKVLASADYNDPVGVLTGFTGIFILFDADGQFFQQLRYHSEDSRISTKKLKDLRKYKTPLVLCVIPLLIFIIFEFYFMSAVGHCGNLITGDTASSRCHRAVDDNTSAP